MVAKIPHIVVSPEVSMEVLSPIEVDRLVQHTQADDLYPLFRRCALAVLNAGSQKDNTEEILNDFSDFDIRFIRQTRGIRLEVHNAPANAFVDGRMIRGIREHLFSVLRDVLYVANQIRHGNRFNLNSARGISDAVFHILRNANVFHPNDKRPFIVCWGGHSIARDEYDYTKAIGYELGLRELNIITGCGPGAMKGPMKGATIAHAKQRVRNARYVGITEPGIIAAESPNPIVNELIIMPDIEKRLEAFVRTAHGVIVFPGGVGTTEEILYLLGILLHPKNRNIPFPLVFTSNKAGEAYFDIIDNFIVNTLGEEARSKYQVIIEDPEEVGRHMHRNAERVYKHRRRCKDSFYFNWQIHLPKSLQFPFQPNHASMQKLNLTRDQPAYELAANLRRAFSGIVAGNVKDQGLALIKEHGPFQLHGDPSIMALMDELLQTFIQQNRMKLGGNSYNPCYQIVR
ncbi:Decarboxylase family protein [gamma proteobacterium HdN1]|nr:Decarboxylase family protein [gamma proteobacterium HdN1]